MSLSAREQQALDVIAERIAGSDPGLASRMATFTRLTAGEDMPLREKILAVRRTDTRHLLRLKRRPGPGIQRTALLVWLVIVVGLVAVAVAVGSGSRSACTKARPAACAGPAPTLRSATHKTTTDSLMLGAW